MELFNKAFENDVAYLQQNMQFLSVKDAKGKSLLHYAVLGSAHDVIDYLLSQDIDVNMTDQHGESAIFDCARKGKLMIAKKLLLRYAKIDLQNGKNETLLHLAAHKGDLEFVQLLIESGAKLDAKTTEDRLPIHYAILAGHTHLVKYFIDATNLSWFHVDMNQNTFLHYATRTTNLSLIRLFLGQRLDSNALNDQFETPLFNAVKVGTKDTVAELLKEDAFIEIMNRRFETPILMARIHQQEDILALLKEWVGSPKYLRLMKTQAMTLAVLNRDHVKLRQLIEQGHTLKKDHLQLTALDYAVKYKFNVCINLLRPLS